MPLLESPASLWLGLTIPAILLLWILRPRRQRLRVPSLLLWPGSPAERRSARPWQRLRNHPLLWIQLLLALLLVAAAVRPFLPSDEAARHLVVLLDASGSMRARDVAPDRFSAAKDAVLDLARGLGPDQEMAVIRMDEQPRALVVGARGAAQVESALAGEEPSYGPADVAIAVALAAGLAAGPAEWVMVGDGAITLPDDLRRPAGTGFRFLQIGLPSGNISVTSLTARQDSTRLYLQAGLRNSGPEPASGRLQLLAEGQMVGAREWQLGPGSETQVSWTQPLPGHRWYEVRLSGVLPAHNTLEHDDSGWVAIASSKQAQVLLVSPGNSFLTRLLSLQSGLQSYQTAPADWPSIPSQGAEYPLVLFDRVWPESLPPGSALLIGPPIGEPFHPQQAWPRREHPLLSHVDWSQVKVGTARMLPLDAGWEAVIDSEGGPLLAIREEGGRRQAALAFDLSQSDLALRPAFPILMANLLDWLLPQPEAAPRTLSMGAELPLETSPLAEKVWIEGPGGARADLAPPWPPRPFRPQTPGLHRLVEEREGSSVESLVVAAGYHPQEADLFPRTPRLPIAGEDDQPPARGFTAFWPWLAAAVLLLSMLEWWVDARGPERFRRAKAGERGGRGDGETGPISRMVAHKTDRIREWGKGIPSPRGRGLG